MVDSDVTVSVEVERPERKFEPFLRSMVDRIPEENLPWKEIEKVADLLMSANPQLDVHHEDGDGNATKTMKDLLRRYYAPDIVDQSQPMPVGQDIEYWVNEFSRASVQAKLKATEAGGIVVLDMNDDMLRGSLRALDLPLNVILARVDHHQHTPESQYSYKNGQVVPNPGIKMDSSSLLMWAVAQEAFKKFGYPPQEIQEAIDQLAVIGLLADKKHLENVADNPVYSLMKKYGEEIVPLKSIANHLNNISVRPVSEEAQSKYQEAIDQANKTLAQLTTKSAVEVERELGVNPHILVVSRLISAYERQILKRLSGDTPVELPSDEYAKVEVRQVKRNYGNELVVILDEGEVEEGNRFMLAEAQWKRLYDQQTLSMKMMRSSEGIIFGILGPEEEAMGYTVRKLDYRFGTIGDKVTQDVDSRDVSLVNRLCGGHPPRAGGILYVITGGLSEADKQRIDTDVSRWRSSKRSYNKDVKEGEPGSEELYLVTSLDQAISLLGERAESSSRWKRFKSMFKRKAK